MERAPQTLVLDASAAAKWFLNEEDTEKALALREAHVEGRLSLTAPDLIVYEIANTLHYHPKLSSREINEYLRAFLELELDLVPPSSEFCSHIVETARRLSVSIYDASYTTLADMMATNLVTADAKLHMKVSKKRQAFLLSEMGRTWNLPTS